MSDREDNFVKCLSIPPNLRTLQDVSCIRAHFKSIEALKSYKELTISEYARIARYEHYEAQSTLYVHGDTCTSWYIVLSGCVLVGQTMFFPRKSFGHRSQGNLYRFDECMILEETELIVFDYSLDRHAQVGYMNRKPSYNSSSIKEMDSIADSNLTLSNALLNNPYGGSVSKRSSHASDTSSAFSGCDAANSSFGNVSYASDNEDDDPDVDSLSQDISSVNDFFYDVLRKDPKQRTESDIDTIIEGIQDLSAFTNFKTKTKHELCRVMRLAVVNNAGEKVLDDGSLLDTWNVILEGSIEVRFENGSVREYGTGDSFGVRPTNEEQRQNGDMWTVTTSCIFFCVLQTDYCEIISRNSDIIIPETEDNGHVVLVYEERNVSSDSMKKDRVIVKGKVDKLINCLKLDESKSDPMFMENFLLTYRVFIKSPKVLAEKLCQWYEAEPFGIDTKTKAKIRKCLLLWTNNHFSDFDDPNADMNSYLERLDKLLSDGEYSARDRLLFFMACSSNSKRRFVTINIEKNKKKLPFRLIGLQRGWGLFVKELVSVSSMNSGLRPGDQIILLSNQSCEKFESLDKAIDVLNSSCSIDMWVKYNPSGFQEVMDDFSESESGIEYESPTTDSLAIISNMLYTSRRNSIVQDMHKGFRQRSFRSGSVTLHGISDHLRSGLNCVITPMAVPRPNEFVPSSPNTRMKNNTRSANTSPNRQTVRHRSKPKYNTVIEKVSQPTTRSIRSLSSRSSSNPDIKPLEDGSYTNSSNSSINTTQVLKVFLPNTMKSKYVLLSSNVTAKEAVILAMKEFSIDHSEVNNYGLYMVSVVVGVSGPIIKCSRVELSTKDLAGALSLNQRYYLKNYESDSQLITDDQAKTLLNETKVTLNDLSAFEIATRITLIDYALFCDIQAVEYINFIFKLPQLEDGDKSNSTDNDCSKSDQHKYNSEGFSTGCENYEKFEDKINRESFWPTSEICQENNAAKRAELIKKFIEVAKICKELKNFNSLVCIITGLTLTPISRLKLSWDKVPNKWVKIYEELSSLTDMSFNFRKIRQLEYPEVSEPPIIPCLAIHSKDLATIEMCHKTCTKEGLINFEKLRMMASEIRKLTTMCCAPYSLQTILSSASSHGSPSFFSLVSPGPTSNCAVDESDATSGISGCSNNSDNCNKKLRSNSVDQFAFNGTLKKKYIKRKSFSINESTAKPPKKIYEEWLSTLKVRTYLLNLNVEMNMPLLQAWSSALEPPSNMALSSNNIGASATSLEQNNNDLASQSKVSSKSSVTIKLSNTPSTNSRKETLSPTSYNAPSIIPVVNNKPIRGRPISIFSHQNQEEVDKLMELVQFSKKITKRSHLVSVNENNNKARSPNVINDQNYLRNIPMYHNNKSLIQEIATSSLIRQDRINNCIPGGVTLNLQPRLSDTILDKTITDKVYRYPVAGGPLNNSYYGGNRKKCMKPDLPSYETARAISQHQRLIHNARPEPVNNVSVTTRPPICPKTPQLPSYNQYVTRINNPDEVQLRRNNPPLPPPRTVTMPQTCKSSKQINQDG